MELLLRLLRVKWAQRRFLSRDSLVLGNLKLVVGRGYVSTRSRAQLSGNFLATSFDRSCLRLS